MESSFSLTVEQLRSNFNTFYFRSPGMGFVRRNFSAPWDESRFASRLGHSPIRNRWDIETSSLLIPCVVETAHLSISTERIWPCDSEEKSERASLSNWYVLSRPGVFALGDLRANRVKRVASAVGDGGTVYP
jgi:hypothetical protein